MSLGFGVSGSMAGPAGPLARAQRKCHLADESGVDNIALRPEFARKAWSPDRENKDSSWETKISA